jgi:MFS family permease
VSEAPGVAAPQRFTVVLWLTVVISAIGFAFDTYVLLMLPLVLPDALKELLPNAPPGSEVFNQWRGLMFFIPAMAGGIFGLLGGYLTDLLGRRRILTWSILLYAFSTLASAYATSMPMLLVLRCATFIGVCVEFVAATAWLAELFPNPRQRERVLGYTQAIGSFGGLMVSGIYLLIVARAKDLPTIGLADWVPEWFGTISNGQAPWRFTLMSGLLPAIPLILIRPFLPESPVWKEKKAAGTLKRPNIFELFAPSLWKTTTITTIMVACSFGAAFGAIQQIPQIVPALPDYQERAEGLSKPEQAKLRQQMAGQLSTVQEMGGLLGRFLLAMLAVRIVSRRGLLRVFQLPGLILLPLVFAYATLNNRALFTLDLTWARLGTPVVTLLAVGIFLAGLCTIAQFSFWGNYLPRVYPVHLRGTGESFAANIGGRMLGTAFAWITSTVATMSFIPGESDAMKMAYTSAGVALFVYLAGSLACFFLPEPKPEALPD